MLRRIDSIASPRAAVRSLLDSLGFIAFNLHKGTTQHSTAQHSTAQHSTAQHSKAQHSTAC
jgi:hypothetical protein